MYKILLIFILLLILILLLIIRFQNKEPHFDDNEIIEYKISNKKEPVLADKFNIKEYDVINENIIIHNKFKNELLNSKKDKEQKYKKECKDNDKKEKEMNKKINKNVKKIKLYELNKNYELTSNQVLILKNNFKSDLNNFLNDKKHNKITKTELKAIIKNLDIEIENNLHKIKKINSNYFDINNVKLINKYENVLLIKDDLLNKKKNIYIQFNI